METDVIRKSRQHGLDDDDDDDDALDVKYMSLIDILLLFTALEFFTSALADGL